MYLLFEKLCNKLLDVKCIILNSLLISRINSVKLINTYSIILKLYKSSHCYLKQNNTKISKKIYKFYFYTISTFQKKKKITNDLLDNSFDKE